MPMPSTTTPGIVLIIPPGKESSSVNGMVLKALLHRVRAGGDQTSAMSTTVNGPLHGKAEALLQKLRVHVENNY